MASPRKTSTLRGPVRAFRVDSAQRLGSGQWNGIDVVIGRIDRLHWVAQAVLVDVDGLVATLEQSALQCGIGCRLGDDQPSAGRHKQHAHDQTYAARWSQGASFGFTLGRQVYPTEIVCRPRQGSCS